MTICFLRSSLKTSGCTYWQNFTKHKQSVSPFETLKAKNWPLSGWQGKRNMMNGPKIENIFALNRLWKPFAFTMTVCGVSVVGSAIWQYENVRRQAMSGREWYNDPHRRKHKRFPNWWNNLNDAEKIYAPIAALNLLVYMAWRVPRWQPFMFKYFTAGLDSNVLCWPMFLSGFSHYSFLHLFSNMFALQSFTGRAVDALGREQFLGMYLSAAVMSSFASYLFKALVRLPKGSLGASGAVMCVVSYVCLSNPDTKVFLIFLPMFPFDALTSLKAFICFDALGCVLRWDFFDHAAHLGGSFFGIFWFHLGQKYIWRKREIFTAVWRKIRGPLK